MIFELWNGVSSNAVGEFETVEAALTAECGDGLGRDVGGERAGGEGCGPTQGAAAAATSTDWVADMRHGGPPGER